MLPAPALSCTVYRTCGNSLRPDDDILAEETAVALVYNGITHVVLMATPQDLAELALGFSLSEGILHHASELYDIEVQPACDGIEVQMEIASARFQALKERRRNMTGRTGCGLCGIDSLAAVKPNLSPVARHRRFSITEIQTALADFDHHQPLRKSVGSVHGVAWVADGKITAAFEDVGRHNALDKLIGFGTRHQIDWQQGFLLISSRASYEMVAKAAAAGIGCIVAVSAPTALAVRLAEQAGMTLIGFAKPQKFNVYSCSEYIETEKKD
ncbi:formate dehydrogenase accessory sulfurtransferase FdhD [Neisseria perflava]|uniref:formate dehydrogenase accessory sulfurtransferase FdhD n=1 Tax=Neisseria perflava TaxID=33053 RepID=UPI0020A054D7|nr:formate dehydrogenase accessory sulfurtransferase FdhD [Neisseria perflava]MCP1659735.1 formate dehydrogenase accessory protein FdhD [Neisseria perflava]MCP1771666.1 formate dehydrogenase accessory protein FdhD [Neisseria perflava]